MMGGQTWLVGVGMNAVGSILVNFGTNIVKLGHNEKQSKDGETPDGDSGTVLKNKTWLVGFTIFMTGNILNFISFGFAAQSLLAALGSIQFLSNVVFARAVLGEAVSPRVLLATFVIVCGNVLLVMFGNQESKTYTLDELQALYAEPIYMFYISCLAVLCLTSGVAFKHLQGKERAGLDVGGRAMPITYAVYSGSLGTQSIVFSKSISLLLRRSLQGENMLVYWQTYVLLFAFIFFASFWVTRLNKSLEMFDAVIIVPLMQVVWTVFAIIGGGIYFQEFAVFSVLQACMFGLGVVTVTCGVALLCPPSTEPEDEDDEDEEKVEERDEEEEESLKKNISVLIPDEDVKDDENETPRKRKMGEEDCPGQGETGGGESEEASPVGRLRSMTMMKSPVLMYEATSRMIRKRSTTLTEAVDVRQSVEILMGQKHNSRMRAVSAFSMPMASIPMVTKKTAHTAASSHLKTHHAPCTKASRKRFKSAVSDPVDSQSTPQHLSISRYMSSPIPDASALCSTSQSSLRRSSTNESSSTQYMNPLMDGTLNPLREEQDVE